MIEGKIRMKRQKNHKKFLLQLATFMMMFLKFGARKLKEKILQNYFFVVMEVDFKQTVLAMKKNIY